MNTQKTHPYDNLSSHQFPARVYIPQRIIQRIRIAVVALRVFGILHVRVGRKEAAGLRVVQVGVHVDKAVLRQVFVPGVTALEQCHTNLTLQNTYKPTLTKQLAPLPHSEPVTTASPAIPNKSPVSCQPAQIYP